MKGRFVAAVALSLALAPAPACRMEAQKPNPNIIKTPAPIVEPIRRTGVNMADDENKEKLKALVPEKAQPEQKAAEKEDASVADGKPPLHSKKGVRGSLDEAIKKIDWSKLEIKQTPRGPAPKVEGRIH